jgi:hypothetical protein
MMIRVIDINKPMGFAKPTNITNTTSDSSILVFDA